MLPKANRLTDKQDYENVRQNGRFVSMPYFSISILNRKDEGESRFGFIVSKKVSTKANVRNKVKRVLREIIRENLSNVKVGNDFVIIAKAGIVKVSNDTIESKLKEFIC